MPLPDTGALDHRIVSGDLLASPAQTLVCAANCQGVMGAGVALAFRERYPSMFAAYVQACQRGELRLGGASWLWRGEEGGDGHWVLCLPTKDHWREGSRLGPILASLDWLLEHYEDWGIESLAVPALGCGRGGISWERARPALVESLSRFRCQVLLHRPRTGV
jgi:O-acetyl-ADP-ribose deacetylase (regulator of RNase III)